MSGAQTIWKGRMGWGSVGFAAGAASVGALWTGVGARALPEPVGQPQSHVILPSPVGQPLAVLKDSVPDEPFPDDSGLERTDVATPELNSPSETVVVPVVIPVVEEPAVVVPEPVAPSGRQLINLNTATLAELDLLPGIGPALAERIMTERARGGRFTSLRDLQRVSGIGPRTAEKLEGLVVFE